MSNGQSDILFVVVLYKENLYNTPTYLTLITKYRDIPLYIYDNSPTAQHRESKFGPGIHYVWDASNPGLSYAYNRAAEYAKANAYRWILVTDQDTSFCEGLIEAFRQNMTAYPTVKLFAPVMLSDKMVMSPYNAHSIKKIKRPVTGLQNLCAYTAINSGMLIEVDAMLGVGGYNEQVWLDYSDYDFLRRMYHGGFDQMYVVPCVCHQSFSDRIQLPQQKLLRFTIFCQCLRSCTRYRYSDNLFYLYIVLKRMLSLMIQTRSIQPVIIFANQYIIGSNKAKQ